MDMLAVQKLSVNVAEAANTFPSLTEDGELVMGNSSSDVIYLDPLTGEERSDDGGLTSITDLIGALLCTSFE